MMASGSDGSESGWCGAQGLIRLATGPSFRVVRPIGAVESEPDHPHPRVDRPLFIPRLGYQQQGLVPVIENAGARMLAAPLYYMAPNPELALVPSERELALALDPSTQLRQLAPELRAPSFRALCFGGAPEAFDPDRDAVSDALVDQLVVDALNLQRGRGATLLLSSFHLTGGCGTRGRELDLLLARAAIEHFRSERMDEPPEYAAHPIRRELYATIAVAAETLHSPLESRRLADAYLGLEAAGYWVKIFGFHEAAPAVDIRAGAAFLALLRESGKPVVSCGPGQLYLGLLADDLSASIGIAGGERAKFPTAWKEATRDSERKGRVRTAYHPKFLRSFRLTSERAKAAFRNSPCHCRRHPKHAPPGGEVVDEHAAIVRCAEAADALDGTAADRREWLLGLATVASWAAHDAGVDHTGRSVYEALFEALDDPGGETDAAAGRLG